MVLTILGSGTSTGVPLISCHCRVCRSRNPRNHRLRASAWLRSKDRGVLIDAATDLRQQALRFRVDRVDAVLFTHPHADHVHGIDELRSYNFIQRTDIPVFGNDWTRQELFAKFSYIFEPGPVEGGGIPRLGFRLIQGKQKSIPEMDKLLGSRVIPISVSHGSKECLGYRIGSVAYVTDCSYIPPKSLDRLQGLSVLVLDCLRLQQHGTHLNLDQALEIAERVRARKTYLTHLGHDFDYATWVKRLPKGVSLAYDGLRIRVY